MVTEWLKIEQHQERLNVRIKKKILIILEVAFKFYFFHEILIIKIIFL